MPFEFFLAQTPAEINHSLPRNGKKAWMACHFSSYGTGLSNLPKQLPKGSMLIVDDSVPVADHDPELVSSQLKEAVEILQCSRVLLDFQRPGESRTADIAKAILQALSCPVGVSEIYAGDLNCSVFLPPLPLHIPLEQYLAQWQDRPIWLEVMQDCIRYSITKDGCNAAACTATGPFPHFDEKAFCRYRTEVTESAVYFTLCRKLSELTLLGQEERIECLVGLYQDFTQPEAQDTALDQ